MEHGIVQTLLLLALLVFAVLFFTAGRGRDRTRDKLLHRPARRSSRSHPHRHP
ncbi:hypothetical protein BLA6993_06042 [Burkholderia lata]|uniref:Uncharacterized protein n=1 Tax=Burkholderia lata (strain ATCC 17760 / DSM 23089 / LMG 22485 / NCIMB 9086 / R18194 / 383) TaxID=482957 RepID=A0A833PXL6_BURL3|nr:MULTISPECIES: hypothetical protein [Burkholderia]KAF1038786.1 MAG: hypothetical protein GAK33_02122 [Burkholderia lata]VWC24283.1 hypothetical protein BLA6993_06042 [Burkholderia lata]